MATRQFKLGSNAAIYSMIVFAIVVVLNLFASNHAGRFDLTSGGIYSLSPQTVKILEGLKSDIEVTGFFRDSPGERTSAKDLLDEFANHSKKFRYEFVDPDKNPEVMQRFGKIKYNTVVISAGDRRETVDKLDENTVTNAIMKLLRPERKQVCFLAGHGEGSIDSGDNNGYSALKQELANEGYDAVELNLLATESIPATCALVAIAGPKTDITPGELARLEPYFSAGGAGLIMLDPGNLPDTAKFLAKYGFKLPDFVVVDPLARMFGQGPFVPVAAEYGHHPITDGFRVATFFPLARPVEPSADAPEPAQTAPNGESPKPVPFALTSRNAWALPESALNSGGKEINFNPKTDLPGPVPIASALELPTRPATAGGALQPIGSAAPDGSIAKPKTARIAVIGDADFLSNSGINISGNRDFAMNTFNWLIGDEDLISIRPKERDFKPIMLTRGESAAVFWIPVMLLPALVAGGGIAVTILRRRR